MNEPTDSELQILARRAAEWAASPEGQAAIEASLRRAEETIRQFNEARKVDWRDLHRPVTI